MPTYQFKCPNGHVQTTYKKTPYRRVVRQRCKKCGLFATRDWVGEHKSNKKDIHLDYKNDPISHLSKKRSFKGVWIENLTPQPVRVTSHSQYQQLLKSTQSIEKRQ